MGHWQFFIIGILSRLRNARLVNSESKNQIQSLWISLKYERHCSFSQFLPIPSVCTLNNNFCKIKKFLNFSLIMLSHFYLSYLLYVNFLKLLLSSFLKTFSLSFRPWLAIVGTLESFIFLSVNIPYWLL
jgi:hypothetical protein